MSKARKNMEILHLKWIVERKIEENQGRMKEEVMRDGMKKEVFREGFICLNERLDSGETCWKDIHGGLL